MTRFVILICCVFCFYSSQGQGDTIVINGRVLEIARDPYGFLKFNPKTSEVTDGWIAFVDDIGRYYKEKLLTAQRHYIELTPLLTSSEKELANQLITRRTEYIISYLETNYQIPKKNMRVVSAYYEENVGAVGIRILDKPISELTRKQQRHARRERKKIDEDEYFEID